MKKLSSPGYQAPSPHPPVDIPVSVQVQSPDVIQQIFKLPEKISNVSTKKSTSKTPKLPQATSKKKTT